MKKKICLLLILVLSLVSIPVFAKDYENFRADNSLILNETIGSTTFAAGNNVKLSSEIDGAAFVAGNMLSISSKQDYLFAAGNDVTITNVSSKDVFAAGSIVTVDSSEIRDLYVAASSITIDSDISRNIYAASETIVINSKIEGDVNLACENIKLGENAVITGKLVYPEEANMDAADNISIGETKTYKTEKIDTDVNLDIKVNPVAIIIGRLIGTLYKFVAMLLISVILLALNKKVFENIEKAEKSFGKVALTSLIGFAVLCLLPIAAIITMITVIGIPLAIISLIVYGLLVYLSIIPTAYYFGNMMFGKAIKSKYLVMILTLLILYVIKMIPIVGGIVGFISLIFGLGMYFMLVIENAKTKK